MQLWKCIFNEQTLIGVGWNRLPVDGEIAMDIESTLCGWFNIYPSRYRLKKGNVSEREEWAAEQNEKLFRQKIKQAADTVESLIQARVDAYNEDHGLAFSDVHNCESYSRVQTYSHRQFCEDVWLWSVDMWETARSIQAEVIAGQRTMPTAEEFIAMLPEYDGVE